MNISIPLILVWIVTTTCVADERPLQPDASNVGGSIRFAAMSALGDKIATCSDWRIQVWSCEDCQLLQTLKAPTDAPEEKLHGVAISPDGETIVSIQMKSRTSRTALLWSATNGQFLRRLDSIRSGPATILTDLTFSPDGTAIWSSDGPSLYRWDVPTGRGTVKQFPGTVHGHLSFANKAKPRLVSDYGRLSISDVETGQSHFSYRGDRLLSGTLNNRGNYFAAISSKGALVWGEPATGGALGQIQPLTGNAAWARFGSLGDDLFLFTNTGYLERWDLKTQRCTGVLARPLAVNRSEVDRPVLYGAPNQSNFISYQPTPLLISPKETHAVLLSGRRFALVPLDWQEPATFSAEE